jgi:hypothetical protein
VTHGPGRLTLRQFWQTFVRISGPGGALVTPTPHREQERFIAAYDARASAGTRIREFLLWWAKKVAKSTTGAIAGLHHLVAEADEPEDRLIGLASYDEEQAGIVFNAAAQIVKRHPWLEQNIRVLRGEMVYVERLVDPRTGGSYTREHRLRQLARDAKGTHGEPWSAVIRDELWSEPDHSMSEALIPSPTRQRPFVLYLSYAPLKTMMRPGVPMYDVLQRAKAGDPSLFYSYIGGSDEDASWRVCPWITPAWIEDQRRLFAASPSRFRRVVLNEEVAGDGDSLLTAEEVQAATDRTLQPATKGQPGTLYYAGLDLGVTVDHAAFVIVHLDADCRVVVDLCKVWRGSKDAPVSFLEVEQYIVEAAQRFKIDRLTVDQWNARLLVQRLQLRGISAYSVTVEQSRIDKIITVVKGTFSRRLIRIAPTETYLLEQLESLRTIETRTPRRDLLKFAPSGTGPDASQHDDAAVALGLCLERVKDRIGQNRMAEMPHGCPVEQYFRADPGCYLWGGMTIPIQPQCKECPGHLSTKAARDAHRQRTGEYLDLRTFIARQLIQPNTFVVNRRFSIWAGQHL